MYVSYLPGRNGPVFQGRWPFLFVFHARICFSWVGSIACLVYRKLGSKSSRMGRTATMINLSLMGARGCAAQPRGRHAVKKTGETQQVGPRELASHVPDGG